MTQSNADDPASHIPTSRVIDWVGRTMTDEDLAEFPIGSVLGFLGTADQIPTGWQLSDGTNGTPDLITRFALRSSSGSFTFGDETHDHLFQGSSNQAATHTHGVGAATGTLNSTYTAGGSAIAISGHDHGSVTTPDVLAPLGHSHLGFGVTSSEEPHLPPYREMPYIMKISDGGDSANIASDLIIFFDPSISLAPSSWSIASVIGLSSYLVGRKIGDADFGAYGNIAGGNGSGSHDHSVDVTFSAIGNHTHILSTVVGTALTRATETVSGFSTHTHPITSVAGAHDHSGPNPFAPDSSTSAASPPTIGVKMIIKD